MSPLTSDRSVVLVDDCKEHCLLTERALLQSRPATRCVTLDSGDAAIRHLGGCWQEGARPDLLLLDWRMPGRSGAEVLAWARSQPHLMRLPILVVSGVAFPEDRQQAAELGADGYLLKPDNLEGYDTLARQVDDWQGRPTVAPSVSRPSVPPQNHRAHGAGGLRALVGSWMRSASTQRALARAGEYVETPTDQLTLDLIRLCRAQGVAPREILREMPGGAPAAPLAQQRRTILRGLAKRGWDAQELAEVFPLTPAAIRLLVRRPR